MEVEVSEERQDIHFEGGVVTLKTMPNHERRTRMKLGGLVTVTVTEMPEWEWNQGVPWQEAHFHRGLTETYSVVRGWMLYIRDGVPSGHTPRIAEEGKTVMFHPNSQHLILLGPGAVIATIQAGREVGNPAKKGQDWWPADRDYARVMANFGPADFERAKQKGRRNRN